MKERLQDGKSKPKDAGHKKKNAVQYCYIQHKYVYTTYETFMDMLYGSVNSLFRNAFYILILCSIVVLSLFDCCASRL